MNPTRSLFGRLTLNGKRTDLGFAPLNTLFIRAAQTYASTRSNGDVNLVLEVSGAKLPDSSILSREQIVEQELVRHIETNPDEESPFEGITMGRVAEAMSSPQYAAWAELCLPDKRMGVADDLIDACRDAYREAFPDCFPHFPKWVES